MQRLLIFLLLLLASVWAGIVLVNHPGYLLVVYQPWMVQMPLWFALISTIFIFWLFYIIVDSIDQVQFLWFRLKNWLRIHREHRSYSKTQQGLATLIEGRWKKAERLLLGGVNQTVEPLINYLAAAKAAQEQGAYDRRDHYIEKAYQVAPRAQLAIGLTQAELELHSDQLEQAQATLTHLRQQSPRHPRVLSLLEKAYVRLADWKNLQLLIPSLRKAHIITPEQTELFEKNVYCELLRSASMRSRSDLQHCFNAMPRHTRKNPDVVAAYVKQLLRFPATKEIDDKEIEQLIRQTLKNHWQPDLVLIYGKLPFTNLNRQLVIAGAWLKIYGQRAEILLLLGQLCVQAQLWGKAKDYFEKCLTQGPNPNASLAYGDLLLQLDDPDEAMQIYQQGLLKLTTTY